MKVKKNYKLFQNLK